MASQLTSLPATRFAAHIASMVAMLVLLTAACCYIANPFGIFNLPDIEGWNQKKFSFFMREPFIKPYQIRHQKAGIVLLGNSVLNTGIPMRDPFFHEQPAYSMAMAGMGIYGNYRILQNLDSRTPVIWAIDFWNFLGSNSGNNPQHIDNSDFGKRLAIDRQGLSQAAHYWQALRDAGMALLSWEALQEVISNARRQHEERWHLLSDGSWGGTPAHAGKSQQKAFQYMEKILFRDLATSASLPDTFSAAQGFSSLDAFREALHWIHQRQQPVTLVIPPTHARWMEVIFMSGEWPAYQQWKMQLVQINEEVAALYQHPPLQLIDFSGYNRFTMESVPVQQDRVSRLRHFQDGVHFSRDIGADMLSFLRNPSTGSGLPGVSLQASNVHTQLQDMQAGHQQFGQEQNRAIQELLALCRTLPDPLCLTPQEQQQRYGY